MPSPAVPQLGADVLVQALIDEQIEVCFANPGTSEMHMVAALDRNPKLRSVLALFEGVVTGAADGYARMAGKPAATLLHLGPGFANGMANIHNARKAGVPMLNLVGDHAVDHLRYDAPLTSDLEGMARTVSHWVGRANSAAEMGQRTREALAATRTRPAGIASLLIAADAAWGTAGDTTAAAMMHAPEAPQPDSALLSKALDALRRAAGKGMLLIGDNALCAEGVRLAAAICHTLNCRLAGQSSSRRRAVVACPTCHACRIPSTLPSYSWRAHRRWCAWVRPRPSPSLPTPANPALWSLSAAKPFRLSSWVWTRLACCGLW